METQQLLLSLNMANFVLTWGVALYVYLANKNKVTNERINNLQTDIEIWKGSHATRIAVLETDAVHLPSHKDLSSINERIHEVATKDLADIHERINSIADDVSNMSGEFKGVKNLLETIHGHLLRSTK